MANDYSISNLDKEYKDLVGVEAYNDKNVTVRNITKDFSKKFDTIQICFLSDTHIGSSDFDIKGLVDALVYADSQENAVVFLLGDGINSAILGSKSDIYEDLLTPGQQLDFYSKIIKFANGKSKLSSLLHKLDNDGKIVVVHSGNHEDRIQRQVGLSASKMAAEIAGVGEAYAPFYANTDIILRQPKAKDGQFHFGVVSHHGTGIKNIDGVFRLLRNVDNADMCVIGHTHRYSMRPERLIRVNEDGEQVYHQVIYMSLPASGGGTYGAGMALPDIKKQTAVWVAVTSQPNPYYGQVSSTGIKQEEFVPAYAYLNPSNSLNTSIKIKRVNQAEKIIDDIEDDYEDEILQKTHDMLNVVLDREKQMWDDIAERIKEKPLKEPKGFEEYLEKIKKPTIEQVVERLNSSALNQASKPTEEQSSSDEEMER